MIKYFTMALFLTANLAVQAQVQVKEIRENRSQKFETKKNSFNFNNDNLSIKMDFKKIGLVAATKYMFQIESAKDSTGKELKIKGYKSDEFREIDRKHMFFGMKEEEKDPNLLSLELSLDQSSRTATYVSVKGNLVLKAGDQTAAFFKGVQAMTNQELKHDLLTKAGIKISVLKGSDTELKMSVSGNTEAIASLKLVNKKGEDASNGSMSSSFGGATTKTLYIKNGMKDIMLKVMVISNMKELKMPFNLDKLKLP
ncbi:MAG: hypothetical protein NE328_24800 [Lentisphaeraceae bacterium]|nr:hypothetical protein [Lentisphaeraceae bacterium]